MSLETVTSTLSNPRNRIIAIVVAVGIALALFRGCSASTPEALPSASASALLDGALAKQQSGDIEGARADLMTIVESSNAIEMPELVVTSYFNLGVLAQAAKKPEDAINYYKRALVIDPTYTPALFNIAIAYTPINAKSAVAFYDLLLSVKPGDANALYNKGLLVWNLGEESAGVELIKRAIKIAPALADQVPSNIVLK
jgi:tetratricopeptide (TPR) repeat protein